MNGSNNFYYFWSGFLPFKFQFWNEKSLTMASSLTTFLINKVIFCSPQASIDEGHASLTGYIPIPARQLVISLTSVHLLLTFVTSWKFLRPMLLRYYRHGEKQGWIVILTEIWTAYSRLRNSSNVTIIPSRTSWWFGWWTLHNITLKLIWFSSSTWIHWRKFCNLIKERKLEHSSSWFPEIKLSEQTKTSQLAVILI